MSTETSVTSLPAYIREIGPKVFAERFGIKERTAFAYMYGTRKPRSKLAAKIIEDSPVTWEGIYSPAAAATNGASQSTRVA
ncbi:MAG TPA: hypothetical protein VFB54_07345 [Burkholderiales bacterium]|nr:hypothetical protein [Burkholderiales bacterium]